jgi:FKBP-type peptidyl-prolyl cis-trans isomerase SlyD
MLKKNFERIFNMKISKNAVVLMHYTLKNESGETLDTSDGADPMAFICGAGNIIPGLESKLEGKTKGDKVNAVVKPEDGYGVKNDDLIQTAPISKFEDPEQVKVGVTFQIQSPNGVVHANVTKVDDKEVTFDMNHPLADQTLHFDVEIVEVRKATKDELDHGHVHGPGGHDH